MQEPRDSWLLVCVPEYSSSDDDRDSPRRASTALRSTLFAAYTQSNAVKMHLLHYNMLYYNPYTALHPAPSHRQRPPARS